MMDPIDATEMTEIPEETPEEPMIAEVEALESRALFSAEGIEVPPEEPAIDDTPAIVEPNTLSIAKGSIYSGGPRGGTGTLSD